MATIINFNQARKNAAKNNKEKTADENRVRFGQKKSDKARIKKENDALISHIKGHKADDPDNSPEIEPDNEDDK